MVEAISIAINIASLVMGSLFALAFLSLFIFAALTAKD